MEKKEKRTVFKIRSWDELFESRATRGVGRKSWCSFPNKQCGLGYSRTMLREDGCALYGAFVALCVYLSKQESPRHGWATDDGSPEGEPLTAFDLSGVTKVPEAIMTTALEWFTSRSMQWIDAYEWPIDAPATVERRSSDGRATVERREDCDNKGGREGEREEGRKKETPFFSLILKTLSSGNPKLEPESIASAVEEWLAYWKARGLVLSVQAADRKFGALAGRKEITSADDLVRWIHCAIDSNWKRFCPPPDDYKREEKREDPETDPEVLEYGKRLNAGGWKGDELTRFQEKVGDALGRGGWKRVVRAATQLRKGEET